MLVFWTPVTTVQGVAGVGARETGVLGGHLAPGKGASFQPGGGRGLTSQDLEKTRGLHTGPCFTLKARMWMVFLGFAGRPRRAVS